jgi:3-methyladenine DNA glycosylase/8-oxoguanine DNA glycosylase
MDLIRSPWTAADKSEKTQRCTLMFLFRSSPGGAVHDVGVGDRVLNEPVRPTSEVGETESREGENPCRLRSERWSPWRTWAESIGPP